MRRFENQLEFYLSNIGYNSTVKAKFEQGGNETLLHIVLHLGIDLSVHLGEIADISGVVEQDGVYGFRVALKGFEDCFIGEKSTHTGSPPFPRATAARQARYAAPLCCVTGQYLSLIHIFGFSVMDETYGHNITKFNGYRSSAREHHECIIEIYHEGDMVFVTEE